MRARVIVLFTKDHTDTVGGFRDDTVGAVLAAAYGVQAVGRFDYVHEVGVAGASGSHRRADVILSAAIRGKKIRNKGKKVCRG